MLAAGNEHGAGWCRDVIVTQLHIKHEPAFVRYLLHRCLSHTADAEPVR